MNFNGAKTKIDAALDEAKVIFEESGAVCLTQSFIDYDKKKKDEAIDAYGFIQIKTENMKDEDSINLQIETETDDDGYPVEEKLDEEIARKLETLKGYAERIKAAENKDEEIIAMAKEIDDAEEAKFRETLEKEDAETKKNVKIALIATAVMLVIAVVCIVVDKLI